MDTNTDVPVHSTESLLQPTTVLIADDERLFVDALELILDADGRIEVVGRALDGRQAIALARELDPDVVLMDLSMPGMSGIEATQRLTTVAPLVRVLVLTVVTDDVQVMDVLLAGASGYLLKDSPIQQIVDGIRAAAHGESLISPRIASQLIRHLREPPEMAPAISGAELTPREHEVLELMARGLDNHEIAAGLYLSPHTVKNHVSSILAKLQVENRIQAAVRAVRGGLV